VTLRWIDLIHPLDVGLIKTTTTTSSCGLSCLI
jgi:hypothetical protein